MTITREDFLRLLPAAVPGLRAGEDGFLLEGPGRTCRIRLAELPPRKPPPTTVPPLRRPEVIARMSAQAG